MEKLVKNFDGKVAFYYIDIEKHPEVGQMLNVSHVPQVYLVKKGELVDSFSGVQDNDFITNFIKKGLE